MDESASIRVENLCTRFELDLNRAKAAMLLSGSRELLPNEFRISSVVYCDRWIWYTKHGYEELINFENVQSGVLPGTAIHDAIEKYFPAGAEIEKPIRKEFKDRSGFSIIITGKIDIRYLGLVIDLKSAEKWSFGNTTKIKPHHLKQVSCYAELTDDQLVGVAYLSKDTMQHLIFYAKPLPHYLASRLPALKIIAQASFPEEVPANPVEKWMCNYCPGQKHCKKITAKQVEKDIELLEEKEEKTAPPLKIQEKKVLELP